MFIHKKRVGQVKNCDENRLICLHNNGNCPVPPPPPTPSGRFLLRLTGITSDRKARAQDGGLAGEEGCEGVGCEGVSLRYRH
jgi:hypothetical protein